MRFQPQLLHGVAHRVEAAVAVANNILLVAVNLHGHERLECLVVLGMREVEVHEFNAAFVVHIVLVEDAIHFFGRQFGMRVVGNVLRGVAQLFTHLRGQHVTEVLLQNVADAAFARLAVDANDVGFVMAAHIGGVDRQVRCGPMLGVMLLAPLQALSDSVLMAAREGSEHELASVGAARLNLHVGHALVQLD